MSLSTNAQEHESSEENEFLAYNQATNETDDDTFEEVDVKPVNESFY